MLDKLYEFLEISKLLYKKFDVLSLLYGSLGLWFVIQKDMEVDDIDILIDKSFLSERWDEFKEFLEDHDYILVDEHEHTFFKDGYYFSYGSIDELEIFADISYVHMQLHILNDVVFYALDIMQYYKVYKKSVLDGYRIDIRMKKDHDKINLIENYLDENMPFWRTSLLMKDKLSN